MQKKPVSVAIVDDHSLLRKGIAILLSESEQVSILFDAQDGVDFQKKIQRYGLPDVVLMDISMPVMDGYEATKWVKANHPQVHVLALSMDNHENKILKMIRLGAGGYLLKTSSISELLKGIAGIARTGIYLNEYITGSLIKNIRNEANENDSDDAQLTAREKEYLLYCCSDMNFKEIAVRMNISTNTLNNYREKIFDKINISNRVGLVLYAIKKGIVKVEDLPDV